MDKIIIKRSTEVQKQCNVCSSFFSVYRFNINKPKKKEKKYCSSICARKATVQNTDREILNKKLSQIAKLNLNKYIYKKQIPKIEKQCPVCNKTFQVTECFKNKIYCSKICYKNDSLLRYRKCGQGGARPGSGRSKSGWYKNIWCNSTYELAFVIKNIDENKNIKRCEEFFNYELDGKQHKYYPDFIIDNIIYEIKGYDRGDVNIKMQAVLLAGRQYILLQSDNIKEYIEYAENKYKTKILNKIYDNYKPKYKFLCQICNKEFEPSRFNKNSEYKYCSRSCSGVAVSSIGRASK